MKFSESWLREWINPELTTEELAAQITMAGLEVDDILPTAGDFSGVVIGEVVESAQHPDADKLRVNKVNVGADELLDIVCGAANCRQGLKVAVAMVGAVLPGNFKIKKAKLRGQPSHGMLCSYKELGIDIESDGILELPVDAPLGTNFREYLNLDDSIIDVDLTANRADCLNMRGLAREVAVLNNSHSNAPEISAVKPVLADSVNVDVQAPKACPVYVSRIIRDVNVNVVTPTWMQEKLRRSGIRSVDPIVDITNFVMLEQGQPMHAFDLEKVKDGITVRFANADEPLTLLDGNEVKLKENTLVIADSEKALVIAGVFGGENSGVNNETTDILLESAFFAPDAIRGRARQYGLHTESSHRFERGVDPQFQVLAMERASALVLEICGGTPATVHSIRAKDEMPKAPEIMLRKNKVDSLLGVHFEDEQIVSILKLLGCSIEVANQGWMVTAPSWRFDLNIEVDLIEEIGRIYGYNNIANQAPRAGLKMNEHHEASLSLKNVRNLLVARGFYEAITYSFVEPKLQQTIVPNIKPIMLPYPISQDMSAMRLSLIPGLLTTVAANQKRQQARVRVFEYGLKFVADETAENGVEQTPMLAGVICGNQYDEHWDIPTKPADFFDLKADLEAIFELTGNASSYKFKRSEHASMHPGQTAEIFKDGVSIGFIGTIHPQVEKAFALNSKAIAFEITWDAIATRKVPEAINISKFTTNRRDIAVIVDAAISADDIIAECRNAGGQLLTQVNLFDVYQGEGVATTDKSLAIALTLQAQDRTLEDEDIAAVVAKVLTALKTKFNAELRE